MEYLSGKNSVKAGTSAPDLNSWATIGKGACHKPTPRTAAAHATHRGLTQGVRIVRLKLPGDLDSNLPIRVPETPFLAALAERCVVIGHAIVAREIGRMLRFPVLCKVVRRPGDNEPKAGERPQDQTRISCGNESNRNGTCSGQRGGGSISGSFSLTIWCAPSASTISTLIKSPTVESK